MIAPKYQHVRIHPWIGSQYRNVKGLFKSRLLILGESEYQTHKGQEESWEDSIWCIRRFIEGKTPEDKFSGKFFSNITTMLLGLEAKTKEGRAFVWESIGFYNYIQRQVGIGPKAQATPEMWNERAAKLGFREVLQNLDPQYIIVLGFENWNWIGKADADAHCITATPPANSNWNDIRKLCWFNTPTGRALSVGIKHPAVAFNAQKWHKWLLTAFPDVFASAGGDI